MASDKDALVRKLPSFRVGGHRFAGARRRKMASVRLGGEEGDVGTQRRAWWRRRARAVSVGLLRRLRGRRVRWVRLQCARATRALRAFYSGLLRDLVEAGAAAEARVTAESYFAIPVLPVSVAAIHSYLHH